MMTKVFSRTILAICIFVGGCTFSKDSSLGGSALRIQLTSEPVSLDPTLAEDGNGLRVLNAIGFGLVGYDRHHDLVLRLASKYEASKDGLRYTFHLRNIKWSDGVPLRADDFVYAISRALDPALYVKLADSLFFIRGAREYKLGKNRDFSRVGVHALDSSTIVFELDKPVAFFPHVLTMTQTFPLRKDVVEERGRAWVDSMPSVGWYRIKNWEHEQRIELELNPHYTTEVADVLPEAVPKEVHFLVLPEEATAVSLFEQGRLDVLFRAPVLALDRLRKTGRVLEFPFFATYYLAFNQRVKPWSDRAARYAFASAVQRAPILAALGGSERLAESWLAPEISRSSDRYIVPESGVVARKAWAPFLSRERQAVIGYDSGARNQLIIERISADIKNNLGLEVKGLGREWKMHLRSLKEDTPPIYRFGWLSPYLDPYIGLAAFTSDSPNNYTGWKNKTYDRIVDAIAQAPLGSGKRNTLIASAQKLLLQQDVVVVPIYHYKQVVGVSKRMRTIFINGLGFVDFSQTDFNRTQDH